MDFELPPDPKPDSGIASDAVAEPIAPAAVVPLVAAPLIPEAPVSRDRGTGLMIFGVFQIILGLLAALMVPFVALGAFMSRLAPGGSMRPGQFVSGVATYALVAAALIGLGIGSVQTKRWAHALTLVISWYWLIIGTLVTILMTAMLPVAMRSVLAQTHQNAAAGPSAEVPTGVMAAILTVIIIFAAFFLVLVPIAFVVFYGREDVARLAGVAIPTSAGPIEHLCPSSARASRFLPGRYTCCWWGCQPRCFPSLGGILRGRERLHAFLCRRLWTPILPSRSSVCNLSRGGLRWLPRRYECFR